MLSKRFGVGVLFVAVLMGCVMGCVTGCEKPAPVAEPTARVVYFSADAAAAGGVSYTGVVHARTESNLGFRVPGKILQRLVDPGDTVKAGQALMKLDATDYGLAINAARAAVEAANARHVQAAADEARLAKLLSTGAVSKQAYEQVKAAADAANAQLEAERAQARQMENQAGYAVLRADAGGVVMEVPVERGQVVSAGQTVVKLASGGTREAVINIPEQALATVRGTATATLYAGGETAGAKLRELSSVADPLTRTYQARFTLAGAGNSAPLGATVTVHIADNAATQSTTIAAPVSALIDKGDGPSVWVIDRKTSTVSLRRVKVEKLGEESVNIASGLAVGERVVAFGSHLLKQGQKVELLVPLVPSKTGSQS